MSINQAAIHYNLPYSSLYGRFKRGKYDVVANTSGVALLNTSGNTTGSIEIIEHSQENSVRSHVSVEKLRAGFKPVHQLRTLSLQKALRFKLSLNQVFYFA